MKKPNKGIFHVDIIWLLCLATGLGGTSLCADSYPIVVVVENIRSIEETEEITQPARDAKNQDEKLNIFKKLNDEYLKRKPDLSGVTVSVTGDFLMGRKMVKITDKSGKVIFDEVPRGIYNVLAEKNISVNGKIKKALARTRLLSGHGHAFMELGTEWVTLKGRTVDTDGSPVTNALVRLEPAFTGQDSAEQYNRFPSQEALSGCDGTYVLPYIKPLTVDMVTDYLVNTNAAERRHQFFYGLITIERTKADGYIPPQLQIPLISDFIFRLASNRLERSSNPYHMGWLHSKAGGYRNLPKSEGNVIFVPDIVLKKATE